MANIISFEGQNAIYRGEGCLDLPAFKSQDQAGNDLIACCYQLTPMERAELRKSGGVLYHWLWTTNPQRDWLTTINPFNALVEKGKTSFVVVPGNPQPTKIIETTDAQKRPLVVIVWHLTKPEILNVLENDGMVFSYLWARNPQPQFVTSLNPWATWPVDPDQR